MNARFPFVSPKAWQALIIAALVSTASAEPPKDPPTEAAAKPERVSDPLELRLPDPAKPLPEFPYPKAAPEHAKDYLRLHTAVAQTKVPTWKGSLHTLEKEGDYGSLLFLKDLTGAKLDDDQKQSIAEATKRLASRTKNQEDKVSVDTLVKRLERAALADVTCHRLEVTLVRWARQTTKAQIGRSEVRKAMERLAQLGDGEKGPTGMDDAYRMRLAEYARGLLKEGSQFDAVTR